MTPKSPADPVAIVGAAVRFPGGVKDLASYWTLLSNGTDAIREVPADRWPIDAFYDPDPNAPGKMCTRWGGFVDGIADFDAEFFRIAPREAERMDPQHRQLLMLTHEALEDAGTPPSALAGTRTGVFVGIGSGDYREFAPTGEEIDVFVGLGNTPAVASNRISYVFDLAGPSLTVDTACSSALVAVHLAFESLQRGESDIAIAGAASAMLSPTHTIGLSRAGFLSVDGRCKAFDAQANGFVRGEGIAVVVLKPLARALADGDRVRAVIRGTAVNQDGRTNGLTAPSGRAQERVILAACARAGVAPQTVGFVEAHGTGTPLGDPIEARALAAALRPRPHDGPPLVIGSAKTNIGHLETSAGLAGLLKAALALEAGIVPRSLHYQTANVNIPFEALHLRVADRPMPVVPIDGRALAGVSSFGFGGTNAHVVLEKPPPGAGEVPRHAGPHVVFVSAKSDEALKALCLAHADAIASTPDDALAHWTLAAARRRDVHRHRAAVFGATPRELAEDLRATALGRATPHAVTGEGRPAGQTAFVYTGQGAQWPGMARDYAEAHPSFRRTLTDVDAAFERVAGWGVLPFLLDPADDRALRTDVAQAALFAFGAAMTALLAARGVRPTAVVGHSVGELTAAYVAGCVTLPEAVRIIATRGRLLQETAGAGRMIALASSPEDARALAGRFEGVEIAAVNGPNAVVFAVADGATEAFTKLLRDEKRRFHLLPMPFAFHSASVDAVTPRLRAALNGLAAAPGRVPLWSTRSGGRIEGTDLDAAYFAGQSRNPVRFHAAIDDMIGRGHSLFVEVGPHPALAGDIAEALRARDVKGRVIPTARRGGRSAVEVPRVVAELFAAGCPVSPLETWNDRPVPALALPLHPFRLKRYWTAAPAHPPASSEDVIHPNKPAGASAQDLLAILRETSEAHRKLVESHHALVALTARTLDMLGHAPAVAPVVDGPTRDGPKDDVPAQVLAVVAERTGYPPDMIQPDMELEADLGIDSIKRVEILAALRDRFSLPEPSPEALGRIRTVAHIGEAISAAIEALPPPAGDTKSEKRDWDAIVLAIVADTTGYPADMLGMDMELESELGIDSVKRIEILAAVREQVPDLPELDAEAAARLRTLRDVVIALGRHGAHQTEGSEKPRPFDLAPSGDAPEGVRRFEAVERPLASWFRGGAPRLPERVLIADGPPALAESLAASLSRRGVPCDVVHDLPEAAAGVVSLAGVGPVRDGVFEAHARVVRAARAVARARGPKLLATVAASGEPLAVARGFAAVVRSFALESPDAWAKALEVDGPSLRAEVLADEILDGGPHVALRLEGGARYAQRLCAAESLARADLSSLDSGSVALVSGGGRGITAECAELLARRTGVRLVVLGRTARPSPHERDRERDPGDEATALRELQRLKPEASLAELRRLHAARVASAKLDDTLARWSALGIQVRYDAVDVSDVEAVRAAVARARAWGPIAAVIHGAGVIEDRAVARTDEASLSRVFLPKVDGLRALLEATRPDPVRIVVAFSSIAGVTGNAGQASYAAANAVVDQVIRSEAPRRPRARVTSIAWGPWAGGMVDEDVRARLARRNIALIDLAQGAKAFLGEIHTTAQAPCVLTAEDPVAVPRDFAFVRRVPEGASRLSTSLVAAFVGGEACRLLEGQSTEVRRWQVVAEDPGSVGDGLRVTFAPTPNGLAVQVESSEGLLLARGEVGWPSRAADPALGAGAGAGESLRAASPEEAVHLALSRVSDALAIPERLLSVAAFSMSPVPEWPLEARVSLAVSRETFRVSLVGEDGAPLVTISGSSRSGPSSDPLPSGAP